METASEQAYVWHQFARLNWDFTFSFNSEFFLEIQASVFYMMGFSCSLHGIESTLPFFTDNVTICEYIVL